MRVEPSAEVDALAHSVIGAAIEVHRSLGPGFLEVIYERALALELDYRAIPYTSQAVRQIFYRDQIVGEHRCDLVVDGRLIVELKAVESVNHQHLAQVLSYLRATDLELALIINFNVPVLRDGIRRVVPRTFVRDGF